MFYVQSKKSKNFAQPSTRVASAAGTDSLCHQSILTMKSLTADNTEFLRNCTALSAAIPPCYSQSLSRLSPFVLVRRCFNF